MNNESLIIAADKIIDVICKSNISEKDKIELMINLQAFLNQDKYEENVKRLKKDKWGNYLWK